MERWVRCCLRRVLQRSGGYGEMPEASRRLVRRDDRQAARMESHMSPQVAMRWLGVLLFLAVVFGSLGATLGIAVILACQVMEMGL